MIEMQSWLVSMERALSLLQEQPKIVDPARPHPIRRAIGAVRFRNVAFGYEEGQTVLEGISLNIAPGTRVAVVGKSGSGKSTLISLLMRMYDPQQGDVLLDCVDLRDWKLSRLREQFTIVLQEPFLFSTSIAENISYTRPGASHAEIVAAAKAAGAHDFISELPDGYNTQIGERGACLSGGQRQRLALARAFLKNAPIVILDEPTSALDQETEAEVVAATERLLAGRTTFIIAHRPSTIQSCEVKLHIGDGRVRVLDNSRTSAAMVAAPTDRRPEFEWGDVPATVM
jgi:ATP-binding cassette subfamily B protein